MTEPTSTPDGGLRAAVAHRVEDYAEEDHSDECGMGACVRCVVDEFAALLAAHPEPAPTPDRCRDCGAPFVPVRRGECSRCGSDAGPAPVSADDTGAGEREPCDDRGPRIGEDGTRCRKPKGHVGDHATAPEDGHGDVRWPQHPTPPADVAAEGVGYTLSEQERRTYERIEDSGETQGLAWRVQQTVTAARAEAVAAERERIAQAIEADRWLVSTAKAHAARIAREPGSER